MKENKKKWMELCEHAADEQDPKKLAALILEINCILEAKELRLTGKVPAAQPPVEADSVDTGTGHWRLFKFAQRSCVVVTGFHLRTSQFRTMPARNWLLSRVDQGMHATTDKRCGSVQK